MEGWYQTKLAKYDTELTLVLTFGVVITTIGAPFLVTAFAAGWIVWRVLQYLTSKSTNGEIVAWFRQEDGSEADGSPVYACFPVARFFSHNGRSACLTLTSEMIYSSSQQNPPASDILPIDIRYVRWPWLHGRQGGFRQLIVGPFVLFVGALLIAGIKEAWQSTSRFL